jgi:hypothetical protein
VAVVAVVKIVRGVEAEKTEEAEEIAEVADAVGAGALGVTPAASQVCVPICVATGSRITVSLTVSEKGKVQLTRLISRVTRGPDTGGVRRDEDGRGADAGCVRGSAAAAREGVRGTGYLHPNHIS